MGGKQLGFGDYEQSTAKKQTKREKFLSEMDQVVPWQALTDLIEPFYPKTGSKGGESVGNIPSKPKKTSPNDLGAFGANKLPVGQSFPSRWATALQLRPSLRQSSIASCFCCAVNRRLVLVGLVISRQSEGHGVTPIDLSMIFWEPHVY
jgi:hypothetical protein